MVFEDFKFFPLVSSAPHLMPVVGLSMARIGLIDSLGRVEAGHFVGSGRYSPLPVAFARNEIFSLNFSAYVGSDSCKPQIFGVEAVQVRIRRFLKRIRGS